MILKLFIENSEGAPQSPFLPLAQHLNVLEKDFAFFLLKRPKLKLGHKDPLLGKLNFMSDNVESLFKYRNLEVRLFNIRQGMHFQLLMMHVLHGTAFAI